MNINSKSEFKRITHCLKEDNKQLKEALKSAIEVIKLASKKEVVNARIWLKHFQRDHPGIDLN